MSTETTNKKIKIDNGTTFGRTYTDKAIDAKLPNDLIASANKLSLGVGNASLGNGVNLDGFTYDEATKTLKTSGGGKSVPPTLWLIDLNKLKVRTTITEEEYNNLKNQLYNQVIYFPDTDYNDSFYLSKLVYDFNYFSFVQCHGVYDDALGRDRIVSLIRYFITIGDKDASGNYPITIEKTSEYPLGSGGGSGIIPQLPADASTSTYVLKAVNGTVQWVKEA